jgi:hypothetical protein
MLTKMRSAIVITSVLVATKMAVAILLVAVWTLGARASPADTTARTLVADWKNGEAHHGAEFVQRIGRTHRSIEFKRQNIFRTR